MGKLRIPAFKGNESAVEAALAYAEAGWYVLPVAPGMKHPGSVVGEHWDQKSSRDPAQIEAWFGTSNGSKRGIALDCGRSGAVVLDVDTPAHYSGPVSPVQQQTRADQPDRRHMVFAQPEGRRIGCAGGDLGKSWGEVRGQGGVIMAYPSVHPEAGGKYTWVAGTGLEVPTIPAETARKLPDKSDRPAASLDTDAALDYLTYTLSAKPGSDAKGVEQLVKWFEGDVANGSGRHEAIRAQMLKAMRWAKLGKVNGEQAAEALTDAFIAEVTTPAPGKRVIAPDQAMAEIVRILVWAVGEVQAEATGTLTTEILAEPDDYEGEEERKWWQITPPDIRTGPAGLNLTLPETTIKGTLAWTGVGQIYGDTQAGKSLVALTLAAAVSDPEIETWFGRKVRRHGHVYYVLWEGEKGFEARLAAWEKGTGRSVHENFHRVYSPRWDLTTESGLTDMVEWMDYDVQGEDIPLIILDTQILAFAGIDFNNNAEMAKVWQRLKRASKLIDTLILTVAHTAKASRGTGFGTASGAGTQLDSSDQSIFVAYTADTKARSVRVEKIKDYAAWDEPEAFEILGEELGRDEDGDPITFPWAKEAGTVGYSSTPASPNHQNIDNQVLNAAATLGQDSFSMKQIVTQLLPTALAEPEANWDEDRLRKAVENAVYQRLVPSGRLLKAGYGRYRLGG